MMHLRSAFLLLLAFLASPLSALTPLSIPNGASGEAPGFLTAVQLSNGNRWHYFSSGHKIFVNALLSNGTWVNNPSPVAIDMGTTHGNDPNSSVAVGTVLAYGLSANTYFNPADGQRYMAVMYFTYQSSHENGQIAGRICLAFSNNGGTWTRPITAVKAGSGKTWADCSSAGAQNSTYTESVSGFHHSASEMHIFWLEGDISLIQSNAGSGRTMTYYATTTANAPQLLSYVGEITNNGIYSPNILGNAPFNFIVNLDVSAIPSLGVAVLSRSYPFPSDAVHGTVPCNRVFPCPNYVAQLPNRLQSYCLKTYSDDSRTTSSGGTWNLIFDIGNGTGWNSNQGLQCSATPLSNSTTQSNVGLDFNSTAQVKNPDGTLWTQGLYGLFLETPPGPECGRPAGPPTNFLYTADLSVCQYAL